VLVSLERRLEGKVALVTGASSGNGRAMALRFAREGAAVVCTDVRDDPDPRGADAGGPTHAEIVAAGGRALFVPCDVTSGEQVRASVEAAVREFGRLDIVVANAGVNIGVSDLVDEPWEQYAGTVAVNQHGVWWTCKEAARQLIAQGEGGRIIVIASVAGLTGSPTGIAYNSSKGAAVQMARTLAVQLAPHGITVNAICPGWIRTAMTKETQETPEKLARAENVHPLGRMGVPDDVAGAAFFLASEDAAWVTGIMLPVDGGYTAI
jgi:NAD(P)-dependent dehydrogenase (short-subunit alcohol dehydrogenase family)